MDLLNSRCLRVVQSRIRRVWGGFSERRRFRLGERRKTPRRKQPRGRFLHARALGTARGSAGSARVGVRRTVALEPPARAGEAGSRRPASAARASRPVLAHGRSRGRETPRARAWASRAGRPSLGMAPPDGNGSMLFAVESSSRSRRPSGLEKSRRLRKVGKKEMESFRGGAGTKPDRAHKVPVSGTWTRFPRIVIELDTLVRPARGADGRAGWRAPSLEGSEGVMSAQV
jgi:hypothetical protein